MDRQVVVSLLAVLASAAFLAHLVLDSGRDDAWRRYQRGADLRVGYALEPPFATIDQDGRVAGESPEVLRTVLRRLGVDRIRWVHSDFGDLIHELHSGRIDVIAAGLFITPERETQVLFTRPTATIVPGLLVRAGAPLARTPPSNLAALGTTRLAVIDGSVEEAEARAAGLGDWILAMPDATSAVASVRAGHADALMLSAVSLRALAGDAQGQDLEVLPLPPAATGPGRPAFALRIQDRRLRDALDRELGRFLGSDEHLALVAGFGITANDLGTNARTDAAEGGQ